MIGLTILGSTGSIGLSTLDVVARHTDRYRVVALSANQDVGGLAQQCRKFRPEYAVLADKSRLPELAELLQGWGLRTKLLGGGEGLEEIAALKQTDYVMAAIVGAAGLLPARLRLRGQRGHLPRRVQRRLPERPLPLRVKARSPSASDGGARRGSRKGAGAQRRSI